MTELKPCTHEVLLWNPMQNLHTCIHCLSVVTRPPATQAGDRVRCKCTQVIGAHHNIACPLGGRVAPDNIIVGNTPTSQAGDALVEPAPCPECWVKEMQVRDDGGQTCPNCKFQTPIPDEAALKAELARALASSDGVPVSAPVGDYARNARAILPIIQRREAAAHAAGRAIGDRLIASLTGDGRNRHGLLTIDHDALSAIIADAIESGEHKEPKP